MTGKSFVTGGTGFLGRRVIEVLRQANVPLVVLDRSGTAAPPSPGPNLEVVRGSLLEPAAWGDRLRGVDGVLHMAAATGRAPAAEHFRTSVSGTELLLEQCRRADVKRILYVSSIAAKFPDRNGYPYAEAKLRAEQAVRASGLRFTIVRPTMILGEGSPILAALETLARLPVVPIFGDGRTPVQPVHVRDVAGFIASVLLEDRFENETLELGGPTTISIEELIRQIRTCRGAPAGATVHFPLKLLLPFLRGVEAAGLGRLLPFSVGQLATFRFDGTIVPNDAHERRREQLSGIADMLQARAS